MKKNLNFRFTDFLSAADDVKMNDLELHFFKVFRYKCFCKKTLLSVVEFIY